MTSKEVIFISVYFSQLHCAARGFACIIVDFDLGANGRGGDGVIQEAFSTILNAVNLIRKADNVWKKCAAHAAYAHRLGIDLEPPAFFYICYGCDGFSVLGDDGFIPEAEHVSPLSFQHYEELCSAFFVFFVACDAETVRLIKADGLSILLDGPEEGGGEFIFGKFQ